MRSGDPEFRRRAAVIDDYFVDVTYENELVRARISPDGLLLHKGGKSYLKLPLQEHDVTQISPTRDTRLRWMQSVIGCTHYVAGASEIKYLNTDGRARRPIHRARRDQRVGSRLHPAVVAGVSAPGYNCTTLHTCLIPNYVFSGSARTRTTSNSAAAVSYSRKRRAEARSRSASVRAAKRGATARLTSAKRRPAAPPRSSEQRSTSSKWAATRTLRSAP